MDRGHDALKRKRLDATAPAPKRERLNTTQQAGDSQTPQPACRANAEQVRSTVKEIFQVYKSLADGDAPTLSTFQALLKASSAGDAASQRLAARLVPRFIAKFQDPELVETAASALIRLSSQQPAPDGTLKALQEHTRQDALQGLGAILKAAQACRTPCAAAVKLILDFVFRLLPQAATADEPSEPEEEGEVAPADHNAASVHFLRRLLSDALQWHPATTLGHCAAVLGASPACSGTAAGSSCCDAAVQAGVRLWLQEHLLKERSPSREGTPAATADAKAGSAAAAATAAHGSSKAAGSQSKGCLLQSVLDSSEELQFWVMQQAQTRAAAPVEVRSLIETALQLLPGDKQLAAAKPRIDTGPAASAAAAASRAKQQQQQQQQRLSSATSLPAYRQQPNGVGLLNGMEPLNRSLSTPSSMDRERSRAAHSNLGPPAAAELPRSQFVQPPGPICRAEACLIVLNLPPSVMQQEVQQVLGAEEVWLFKAQGGSSAVCTFKGVVEAAKAYLRHNGVQRLPNCPPLCLAFSDRLPPCSAKAGDAGRQPSVYVWATRDAVGDAESITDELRAAGLQLSHVHRVNNAAEPGTLLQTPSSGHAASVVEYLLKKHPQQQRAAPADKQELPPLPPEPPPGAEWTSSKQQQQQQGMPPLPPGPPPNYQQQQQQQQTDQNPAGGRPISPAVQQQQQQQHQHQGYMDGSGSANSGVKRSYSSPAVGTAAAGSGWRDSPSEWAGGPTPPTQARWGPGGQQQQQHTPSSGVPPPAPPPLPPGQQQLGQGGAGQGQGGPAGSNGGSWHPVPHQHQQQQQQGRWGNACPPPGAPIQPGAMHHGSFSAAPQGQQHPGMAGATGGGHMAQHMMHAQRMGPAAMQMHAGASPHVFAAVQRAGSAGSSPAAMHGQQQQQQQQQHGPGPGRVLWQGSIVKQSVHMCGVACLHSGAAGGPGGHQMAGFAPEPRWWPDQLHVNFRISVADAVEQYTHSPVEQRAIRLLLPLNPDNGDTQQLQQFINYLNGKERAGMVKLPALRERGLPPRAVYLIVPKAQVCQQLQVGWDGRDVMLIAVVVPQPTAAAGPGGHTGPMGGGSSHRQMAYRG